MTRALHEAQDIAQPSKARTAPRQQQRAPERLQAVRPSDRTNERRLQRPASQSLTDDGRFSLDKSLIPAGYVMEFKRHTVMGMEDKRNQVLLRKYFWEPVTHKMQPHILGHLCTDDEQHIIVDGLALYMRAKYLNDDANAETKSETDYQLNQQMQSLRMSSKQQVGAANTYIRKTTVAAPQAVE
jgi:hypothetical protein